MKIFYRFMIAWSQIDLMIARSTGRNPDNIAAISKDIQRWELELFNLEWRMK